jgi:methenyltetrahydromethanopterin cyclohydrolase
MSIGSVNRRSAGILSRMLDDPGRFGVQTEELKDGSTVVDASRGSFEAGMLIGEICMGGLGRVDPQTSRVADVLLPSVRVSTDHPLEACLLSQLAGWSIKAGKFRAMGSGPARALARAEEIYGEYDYKDDHDEAVIVLETSSKPTTKASGLISEKCGIRPSDLRMVLTPTASLAGAVQISARIVETGLHKMHTMDLNLDSVLFGAGSCPVPPLCPDDMVMMGRTNDAMLYGGSTYYAFGHGGPILAKLDSVPSSSSSDHGKPFGDVFKAAGYDFYKIDPGLFSPAVVAVNDASSGRTLSAGRLETQVLKDSFGLP